MSGKVEKMDISIPTATVMTLEGLMELCRTLSLEDLIATSVACSELARDATFAHDMLELACDRRALPNGIEEEGGP